MRGLVKPRRHRRSRSGHSGFSMVELIIVIAIFGILLAVGAPSMTRLIAQQRLKSAATDLHLALVKARAEAIKRNCKVGVGPDGGWANGWTVTPVVTTAPAPPECPAASAGEVLERRGPANGVSIATAATQVIYTGTGRTTPGSAASFVFTVSGVSTSRCLSIDSSGRPVLKEGSSC